jgi:large repetitive protein
MAIQTQAPTKPVVTSVGHAGSGAVADSNVPVITGTGDPGNMMMLYDGIRLLGTVTVAVDGSWSLTPAAMLKAGSHSFTALARDPVTSAQSNSSEPFASVLPGPVIPPVPSIDGLTDNVGPITGPIPKNSTTDDSNPVIAGKGVPGDVIHVLDNGKEIGTATVTPSGDWTFKPTTPLADGAHDITATQTNPATGATSPASADWPFKVDTTIPSPSEMVFITSLTDHSTGATIPANGSSKDTAPVVHGTVSSALLSGEAVVVYRDGVNLGKAIMNGTTTWTYNDSGVAVGTHKYTARVESSSGTGEYSAGYSFTEGLPPSAPTITGLIDVVGPFAGNVAPGGTSSDAQPTVTGKGVSGDTINVYDGSMLLGTTKVQSNGTWSFKTPTLSNAGHSITASETNAVGTSSATSAYSFNVDTMNGKIVVTGLYSNGVLIPKGGSAHGAMTATVWIDPSIATATGTLVLYIDGTIFSGNRLSITGNTATVNITTAMLSAANGELRLLNKSLSGATLVDFQYGPSNGAWIGTGMAGGTGWNYVSTGLQSVRDLSVTHSADNPITDVVSGTHDSSSGTSETTPAAQAKVSITAVGTHDAFKGTTGHDTVDLNADPTSYFKETTAHIEGSTVHPLDASGGAPAVNTLHLIGDHQILDLTSLTGKTAAAKISGIEVIDLGGHSNTLKLSLTDVLNLGETDLFQKDGKQQMMVQGKDGDVVDLSNSHVAGLADGEWQLHGTAQVGGVTYNVYEHSGAHTELLVQQGVQITVH